jgi:poly-D-alanine transfer protein DltD
MKRLSNSEAERVISELAIDDTTAPAIRAAHRLHEFFDPYMASELVENYAQTEVEKVAQQSAVKENTNAR